MTINTRFNRVALSKLKIVGGIVLVLIDEIDELGLSRENDGDSVYELLRLMRARITLARKVSHVND